MAKAEGILEYATANTRPIINTVAVENHHVINYGHFVNKS